MSSVLMEALKPEIDKKIKEHDLQRDRINLFIYVQDGDMKLENAAKRAGLSTKQFQKEMDEYFSNQEIFTT